MTAHVLNKKRQLWLRWLGGTTVLVAAGVTVVLAYDRLKDFLERVVFAGDTPVWMHVILLFLGVGIISFVAKRAVGKSYKKFDRLSRLRKARKRSRN